MCKPTKSRNFAPADSCPGTSDDREFRVHSVSFRAGDDHPHRGRGGRHGLPDRRGSVEVSVGKGARPGARDPRRRRRLRRDEPDRPRPALGDGPGGHRRRVRRDQLRRASSPPRRPTPSRRSQLMQTLVRRLRQTNERIARIDPGTGHRIQQWLHVILAGLDEQDGLSPIEMEALQRELRMLLQIEHFQIAPAEVEKAEQVLAYMFRPTIEECLNLWFGKVEADRPGDLEPLRRRRGAGLARALRPLGAQHRASAAAGGARHHARPVPPQHVPRDAGDVRLRPALPRAGQARPAGRGRRAAEADRAGLPLPRPHPFRGARGPAPLHGGVGAGRCRSSRPTTR